MMHFGISGKDKRKSGHADFSKPLMKLHDSIDYLALGHFHSQYTLPTKDPWVFNPGSLEVNEITEFYSEHGAFLVEIYSNKKNDFKVKSLLCQNGTSDDPLSIPNRRFISEPSINISRANSFEEAQELVIDRIKRLGVPLKSNQTMSKDNLDLPVLFVSIEGEVSYSQLEIDFSKLREKISYTFDILGAKIKNQITSQMEGNIRLDEDLSVDQIERALFQATIETENIFEPHKEKIVDLILKLKGELSDKPNYNVIKSNFNTWSVLNSELFQKIIKEIVEREKKLEKQAKPKKKKLEAKPEKKRKKEFEEAGAEAGEFDFEKAFDFDALLNDKNVDDVLESELESNNKKDLKTDVVKKVEKRVKKQEEIDVDKEDVDEDIDEDIDEEFDENIDDRDLDL
jgi:DNA repair exonuclease SbcCD nuclease subunit